MPAFFLAVFLLLSALSNPSLADDRSDILAACGVNAEIPVHVTPRFDAPAYDYSKSIRAITAAAADSHHSIHENLTLGLTQYEPILSIHAPVREVQSSDGLACAHIEHLDVSVGYQHVTVSIAREIPQGSCGFNEVMAHEQKHISVNMQILQEYTPRIEAELGDYVRQNGNFQETNADYALKLLHEKLQDIIESIMKDMTAENQERQQAVDTPAEYARISAACNGQLRFAAADARRKKD